MGIDRELCIGIDVLLIFCYGFNENCSHSLCLYLFGLSPMTEIGVSRNNNSNRKTGESMIACENDMTSMRQW